MKKLEKFMNGDGIGLLGIAAMLLQLGAFIGIFIKTRMVTDVFVALGFLLNSFAFWLGLKVKKFYFNIELPDEEDEA